MELPLKQENSYFDSWQIFILAIVSVLILLGTHLFLFSLVAFIICAYIILMIQGEFALMIIVYTMSFAHIFKISESNMSYFTFLILLYVIISAMKYGMLPIVGVIFGIYIVLVQSIVGVIALQEDIKLIGNILFLYYAFQESRGYEEKKIFLVYVLGVIVAATMRFLDSSFFRITAYAGATEIDFFGENAVIKSITRFAGIYQDANYFGVNVILALCILVVMYGKQYLKLLPTIILTTPLLYFSVLTGSKSVLMMSVLPFFVFIVANHKDQKHFTQILLVFGILVFIYLFLIGRVHFLDAVLQRLEGKSISDPNALTTGRFDVWMKEVQFFFENPRSFFMGVGIGNHNNQVWAHNAYLESLKYIGLFGTGMVYFAFKETYNQKSYDIRKNFMNYSGIITVLVMYFFLNQLYGFEFPIHFLLAFMLLDINFEYDEQE